MNVDITDLKTVRLSQDGSAVIILDQTCLPGSEVYVSLSSAEEIEGDETLHPSLFVDT